MLPLLATLVALHALHLGVTAFMLYTLVRANAKTTTPTVARLPEAPQFASLVQTAYIEQLQLEDQHQMSWGLTQRVTAMTQRMERAAQQRGIALTWTPELVTQVRAAAMQPRES